MSTPTTSRHTDWIPGLVDLLARRPDLEGIGYAPLAREVAQ